MLYTGTNDGVRTVAWRGTQNNGEFAPPGTYSIIVSATPTTGANTREERDSRTFRLEHLLEPLEDTLPSLDPNNPRRQAVQQAQEQAATKWWEDAEADEAEEARAEQARQAAANGGPALNPSPVINAW